MDVTSLSHIYIYCVYTAGTRKERFEGLFELRAGTLPVQEELREIICADVSVRL